MVSIYPNLPGFSTQLQDYNLRIDEEVIQTQKVVILGTATDGPVGQPVVIRRPEEAEAIFGKAVDENGRPNGATLLPKFYEVYQAGARNIALMRISGDKASNSLAAAPKNVTKRAQFQEVIGIARGNNEVTFNPPGLQPGDRLVAVSVIANGKAMPSSAIRFDDQSVTILEDQTDSNSDIAIEYSFLRTEVRTVNRKILKPINTEYDTFHSPDGEMNWLDTDLTVWVNGVMVDASEFTLNKELGMITFYTPLNPEDVVEASFKHAVDVQIDDFVTGLVATGSPQVLSLQHQPVFTTFRLFANGYEVDKSGFLLDVTNKKVTLLPGRVPNGATLLATYEYEIVETVYPSIKIEALHAGSLYNNVLHRVEDIKAADGSVIGKKLVIIKPESKKTSTFEAPMEFSSLDYPTFKDLCEAVNNDRRNNVVRFSTDYPETLTSNLFAVSNLYLTGGRDGINLTKRELYEKLGGRRDANGNIIEYGAYQLLENYDGDIYIPAGVYADDDLGSPNLNFADQLAQFCAIQTLRNNECRGVIAVRPPKDNTLASIMERINELLTAKERGEFRYYLKNLQGEYMRDEKGRRIDIGRHIDLVFGVGRVSNELLGAYSTTLEAAYAGLQSALSPASDTTEKILPGVYALDFELSVALHDRLSEAGFVSFYTDPGRGVVVTNGITAADTMSDYRSLPNVRIALEVGKRIREVSKKYLGEPYNLIQKNAHATDIQVVLDNMVEAGMLIDFNFSIHQSVRDRMLHNAIILLDIVPAFSLKRITMPVSLRPIL